MLFHYIPRADTLGYYIVAPSGLGVLAGRIFVFIDFVFVVILHYIPRADTLGYYIVAPSGFGVSAGRIFVFIDFVFIVILSGLLQKKATIPPKSRRTYT